MCRLGCWLFAVLSLCECAPPAPTGASFNGCYWALPLAPLPLIAGQRKELRAATCSEDVTAVTGTVRAGNGAEGEVRWDGQRREVTVAITPEAGRTSYSVLLEPQPGENRFSVLAAKPHFEPTLRLSLPHPYDRLERIADGVWLGSAAGRLELLVDGGVRDSQPALQFVRTGSTVWATEPHHVSRMAFDGGRLTPFERVACPDTGKLVAGSPSLAWVECAGQLRNLVFEPDAGLRATTRYTGPLDGGWQLLHAPPRLFFATPGRACFWPADEAFSACEPPPLSPLATLVGAPISVDRHGIWFHQFRRWTHLSLEPDGGVRERTVALQMNEVASEGLHRLSRPLFDLENPTATFELGFDETDFLLDAWPPNLRWAEANDEGLRWQNDAGEQVFYSR